MSRTLSWGVAVGATLLISLTGCSQPGQPAAAGNPTDSTGLCGILGAPVTAQLVKAGITASPINGGGNATCRWQDQASGTSVTLTSVSQPIAALDGNKTTIPGVGSVNIVAPGELSFEAGGKAWDVKVDSKDSGDANTRTATDVVTTVGAALGGGQATPTAAAKDGAGTTQKDATVTVTDANNRTTDLRLSTVHVATPDGVDLGNGQTVPLDKINKIGFSDAGDVSDVAAKLTLTDGSTVTGKLFVDLAVDGESDFGAFRQLVSKLKSVEFRRDTPFTATAAPQLAPWEAAKITVTETPGTSTTVAAPSLRFLSDPGVTLDNGQSVLFEKITKIDAAHTSADVTDLDITLVTGKKVTGSVNAHISIEGDGLATTADQLKSIAIDRGVSGS